ncbi:MAG: hypothetical protein WC554_02870 [Clostridia bacterium]
MIKKSFIKLWKNSFKQENKIEYLTINTEYKRTVDFGIDGIFECIEGKNLKEITDYLDNEVPKSQRKYWKIYKELGE